MGQYTLTKKEEIELHKFYNKHFKSCGGHYVVTFESSSGIGLSVKVKCPVCKKKKDITDVACW